jgi:hypothetical protein
MNTAVERSRQRPCSTSHVVVQYHCPVVICGFDLESRDMKLRIISGALWFLAGWAFGATIAFFFGLNPTVGPLVGIAWAAFVVADPRHLLWHAGAGSSGSVPAS